MPKKKVVKKVVIKQEGDKDPFAEGKHIKNPEPNNNRGRGRPVFQHEPEASVNNPGLNAPHDSPNEDIDELEEALADSDREGR